MGRGIPAAFPLPLFRMGIRSLNDREGQPAVLYFHPWEIDPGQPKIPGFRGRPGSGITGNLERTEGKIRGAPLRVFLRHHPRLDAGGR